jgi:hypothetical protein
MQLSLTLANCGLGEVHTTPIVLFEFVQHSILVSVYASALALRYMVSVNVERAYNECLAQRATSYYLCKETCSDSNGACTYVSSLLTRTALSINCAAGGMYGKLGHGNENGHSTPCRVEHLGKYCYY